jgi:predicted metalloprotease with PDZ domain
MCAIPGSLVAMLACGLVAQCAADAHADCRFGATASSRAWTYRFRAEGGTDPLRLHVTAQFPLGPAGTLRLKLPTRWAGETLRAMRDLRSGSADVRLDVDPDGGSGVLHGEPGAMATVTYDLEKDWTGLLVHPRQFHPVLMPEYVEFTGHNALVFPSLETPAAMTALTTLHLDFTELPSSWVLATSFGTGTGPGDRCQVATVPAAQIVSALFAAGDFRLREFSIGRRRAVLAVRGTWTFSDEEAIEQIRKTVAIVRDFWRDDAFPYFLVTLKPYDRERGSSDGSEFTNAFWLYVSRLDTLADRLPQLAHESFHAWNPGRMGVRPDGERVEWFTEGFTDYYAYRLLLQAHVLSSTAYVESLNQALRRFTASGNPYVRGRIVALWVDGQIRLESRGRRSLDDAMYQMVRGRDRPLTRRRILSTIARYIPRGGRAAVEAAVDGASLAAPERLPLVPGCTRRGLVDVPTFDLGFDLVASRAAGTIVGVRASGAAYAAGLRNGQRLTGRMSVTNDDPEREAVFGIRDGAGEREVRFFPRGESVQAWQYEIADCGSRR